jgi:hypothetical protein
VDAYASASESEEEDEADEDSNGMSHDLSRIIPTSDHRSHQRKSITKTTILMKRVPTMIHRKMATVRVFASLVIRSFLWKQLGRLCRHPSSRL